MLKSWIKDKNTIVVEKQPWFDNNGSLILYFVTMYAQLNQGANVIKGTKQMLTVTTEGNYLRFNSDTFVVVFDHRVFMHLQFSGCSYAYQDQPENTPPMLLGVDNPSAATIVCQGETFTFKLDQALADNGGIYLVIEATEGQSNGVSRAHAKASAIKMVEEPTAAAIDIRADYVAKNGALSAAAPKIFFRYYYVNSSTGEKSGVMLAETS